MLVPVIVTTLLAFTDWNGFSLPKWVGFANCTGHVELTSRDPHAPPSID